MFSNQCSNTHTQQLPSPHPPPTPTSPFDISVISAYDVFDTLKRLPVHKAAGGDIPNRILKETAGVIAHSLCKVFNLSITQGRLPPSWKTAQVVPIYKQRGSTAEPQNYRPISLLNSVAKVLDSIVARRLSRFLRNEDVIVSDQFGSVHGRSTVDQLIHLTASAAKSMDSSQEYDVVFLDFAKAFDRVPHSTLLALLQPLCNPTATTWFAGYLAARKLQVKVGEDISPLAPISAGVPQGSHLGPILFLLYINTLPRSIPDGNRTETYLYADDTAMGLSRPPAAAPQQLQSAVNMVMDWAATFGGRFNAAKSVRVVFGKLDPAQTPAPALRVDAADLCPSTTHRHLGITLDPRLSFQTHINSVTSNFRRRVVLLSYMSPNLTPALIARLYKGYVRPSIEYASPLWNNKLTAGNIDTLERLQARVARQYLHRRKVPIPHGMENVFEAAEWESLAWRRHIHCLKLFYHFTRQYPETLNNLNIVLSKSARRPHFYLLPTHTGPCFRSTLLHSMITTWNSLPTEIRISETRGVFSRHVKSHFHRYRFHPRGFLTS